MGTLSDFKHIKAAYGKKVNSRFTPPDFVNTLILNTLADISPT